MIGLPTRSEGFR